MEQSENLLKIKPVPKEVETAKEMVKTCIQCGTCSGSCPNIEFMDITPRKMWRLLLTDHLESLFSSKSFSLCSSCYYCTLRCPRGLELTAAMGLLKQADAKIGMAKDQRGVRFYKAFMDSVEKHGRVKEVELMTHYFISMKNPMIPIKFMPLGVKLMKKKKLHPDFPFGTGHKLSKLFKKAAELEA